MPQQFFPQICAKIIMLLNTLIHINSAAIQLHISHVVRMQVNICGVSSVKGSANSFNSSWNEWVIYMYLSVVNPLR